MTVSEAQLAANRSNATKSTGAKTPAGKQKASTNAMKHGWLSEKLVIEVGEGKESQEEFDRLLHELLDETRPQGVLERLQVDRMATAVWKLRRVQTAENGILRKRLSTAQSYDEWGQEQRVREALQSLKSQWALHSISPPELFQKLSCQGPELHLSEFHRKALFGTVVGLAAVLEIVTTLRGQVKQGTSLADEQLAQLKALFDSQLTIFYRTCSNYQQAWDIVHAERAASDAGEPVRDNLELFEVARKCVLAVAGRELQRWQKELSRLEREEKFEYDATVAEHAVVAEGDFAKIHRYETKYQNQFHQALQELERLQSQRQDRVATPLVVPSLRAGA